MPSVCFLCYVMLHFDGGDLARLDLCFFSDGSQVEALTPSMAAKCGFSVDSDPWGNTKVYASLLNCFAGNEVWTLSIESNCVHCKNAFCLEFLTIFKPRCIYLRNIYLTQVLFVEKISLKAKKIT